jgi:manganese oxidase
MGHNGSTPGPVIVLKKGEWISLTVENRLDKPTALNIHGHDFVMVAVDGFQRKEFDDTIDVASGRRIDIEFLSNNQVYGQ